jgi:hypothetical protein
MATCAKYSELLLFRFISTSRRAKQEEFLTVPKTGFRRPTLSSKAVYCGAIKKRGIVLGCIHVRPYTGDGRAGIL